MPRIIDTQADLKRLAKDLGVRDDWHEPDEEGVDAVVRGNSFDNAGFWPEGISLERGRKLLEKHVVIKQNGKEVAVINLATLLAMASGTLK